MMRYFYLFVFCCLLAGFSRPANAQNISNEGAEFWLAFATHDPSGNMLALMNVNVTSKENTEVTVSCGAYSETKKIPANTVVVFAVPRPNSYIDYASANTVLSNKAIHVVVTKDQPNVSVYSHVYANARSAASLILPVGALGQKYYSMNYEQDVATTGGNPARNFLVLVAAEANTQLLIHTKKGTTIPVTLPNVGDVYEYIPAGAEDLTGTAVEVDENTSSKCKKFAAFSGSTSLIIACGNSRDPLYQQLYPVSSWGKNYGIVPFYNRRYIVRILAQEDNTLLNVGGSTMLINKGAFYESGISTEPMLVSADKLISVAQYSLTQTCSSTTGGSILGDPEMVLLNPTEFNINKITLFSAAKNDIRNKYLNVFMKTDKTGTFRVNGALPSNGTWMPMPDPAYSYIQIEVGIGISTEESLTLTAADGFNAIAYGFGQAESYAYSAGTNLASSQYLVLLNKVTNQEITEVCVGQEVEFNLTLPYLLTKINWEFDDGSSYAVNTPAYTTKVVNNQTLYTYKLDQTKTFSSLNDVKLKVTGDLYAGAQQCNLSTFDFTFTLHVNSLPSALIGSPASGCLQEKVNFTDKSSSNMPNKLITKWAWDFDDPGSGTLNTSDQQNPSHSFTTPGKHMIKLRVGTESGCLSDYQTFEIYINPKPVSTFKTNLNTTCPQTTIQFTDNSTVSEGAVVKWTWDFGDGTPGSSSQNTQHSYAVPGTYKVTLKVETDKGCTETSVAKTIEITAPIESRFNAPDICVRDPLTEFENLSVNVDGTKAGLTYQWDFGDPSSGVLNQSTEQNGKHAYTRTGQYLVTLSIKNENNCVAISSQTFTVNGQNPVAKFEVINRNQLCSNTTFTIRNKSFVQDFGSVTKVVTYVNGVEYIDNDPAPDKDYIYTLPESTSDIPVHLIMLAYSGGICVSNPYQDDIVLHASPQIRFDALVSICYDAPVRQLLASQISNLPGNGVFSGDGVTTQGLFNPRTAGLGVHAITYTFVTDKGCSASITQTIMVNPVPELIMKKDLYILAGGEKRMDVTTNGNGLKYKWSPAVGLSRDDVANPLIRPEKDTNYTLTVTSDMGCAVIGSVFVHVLPEIDLPNSFSPNGDGINDVWNIRYLDTYPKATVEVYNRNGTRVFNSNGYKQPFDGNFHNQPLPVGIYYYIVNPRNGREAITGSLTLIR